MCHKINTLSKNCHGQLDYCSHCNVFQLHFNNIYIEFTQRELKAFQKFVVEIDIEYWKACCGRAFLKRKIPIQTVQQNLVLMFDQQELNSLKDIIFQHAPKPNITISVSEIDYNTYLN